MLDFDRGRQARRGRTAEGVGGRQLALREPRPANSVIAVAGELAGNGDGLHAGHTMADATRRAILGNLAQTVVQAAQLSRIEQLGGRPPDTTGRRLVKTAKRRLGGAVKRSHEPPASAVRAPPSCRGIAHSRGLCQGPASWTPGSRFPRTSRNRRRFPPRSTGGP